MCSWGRWHQVVCREAEHTLSAGSDCCSSCCRCWCSAFPICFALVMLELQVWHQGLNNKKQQWSHSFLTLYNWYSEFILSQHSVTLLKIELRLPVVFRKSKIGIDAGSKRPSSSMMTWLLLIPWWETQCSKQDYIQYDSCRSGEQNSSDCAKEINQNSKAKM